MSPHHIPENLPRKIQHYIDGKFVDSLSGKTFDVLDPVSNETYAQAAAGQSDDIAAAVAAAKRAFDEGSWPRMVARARARVLNRIADRVEAEDKRLAGLETFDTGLPIKQALGQAQRAAENFRFFADLIVAQADDAYKVPGQQINYVNRKPVGVAGLITPWNTPFMLESWKLAPALASGCTVVLKPAEFTPLSASLWAGIFQEAGLPVGVFNLVNGLGEEVGDALVKHPDVRLISFTGETTTGQIIYRNAAAHLKGLSMELGGKSPAIVFFFFNDTATTEIYTLSLHDALPICSTLEANSEVTCRRSPSLAVSSAPRSEEHTSELQSLRHLVCRLLLEKKTK